jgi:hypothetical protein
MDVVTSEILVQVKDIDFGCGFVDGKCVAVDKRIDRGLRDIGKICCRACHHNVGYLRVKEDQLPPEYLSYFSYPNGFCGDNGCTLPIEMRARRCVIYVCRDSDISDADREVLLELERTT